MPKMAHWTLNSFSPRKLGVAAVKLLHFQNTPRARTEGSTANVHLSLQSFACKH